VWTPCRMFTDTVSHSGDRNRERTVRLHGIFFLPFVNFRLRSLIARAAALVRTFGYNGRLMAADCSSHMARATCACSRILLL
jgi:hypothetical protein